MNRVLILFLLAACTTVGAEVFRHVGPDGTVTFSDTPASGAERVNVAPAQAVNVRPVPQPAAGTQWPGGDAGENPSSAPSYDRFAIVEPSNGQSVRANDGSVTISLALEPALVPGHTIELVLDGEDGGKVYSGTALTFMLSGLSRGEHTASARVKNGSGDRIVEAGTISFYILRVARGG